MSPGFLVCIWLYDVNWMFRLLWQHLFPLATVLSLLRLDFFPPAGPSVIYVHYLVRPNSDLSLFLFSAEEYCKLTTGKFVALCVVYCGCCKDHCSESRGHVNQTAERKRLTQGQFLSYPNDEPNIFSFHNPDTQLLISAVRR